MSLILEALRKSEAERQREGAPSVAMELPPVPARGAGATPGWVWPTLAIVVVGAVLAGWLGIRAAKGGHTTDPAAQAAPAGATPPAAAAAPSAPAGPAPLPAPPPAPLPVPQPAPPAPASPSLAAAPEPPPAPAHAPPPSVATPPPAPPAPSASLRPVPAPAPAITPRAEDSEDAPPISATGLPAVKLSMHMWDADPGKRFVILDGQRMGEGDRNGSVQVIAIRRDGVIIERSGIRARVPLP